ncbi:MAG: hypothetical protein KGH94_04070 [Candidatus Micrarchaeota archaeon]|nr:hypothetical protein [Candidatus Micrarchaeota archaeon]
MSSKTKGFARAATASLLLCSSMVRAGEAEFDHSGTEPGVRGQKYSFMVGQLLNQSGKRIEVDLKVPDKFSEQTSWVQMWTDNKMWWRVGVEDSNPRVIAFQIWDDAKIPLLARSVAPPVELKGGDRVTLGIEIEANGSVKMSAYDKEHWKRSIDVTMTNTTVKEFISPLGPSSNHSMHVENLGTGAMTAVDTTDLYVHLQPQWYHINYPAITNRPVQYIMVSELTGPPPFPNVNLWTKFEFVQPQSTNSVGIMGNGKNLFILRRGDCEFGTQSTTNYVPSEP